MMKHDLCTDLNDTPSVFYELRQTYIYSRQSCFLAAGAFLRWRTPFLSLQRVKKPACAFPMS